MAVRIVTDAQRRARIARHHGLGAPHRHPTIAMATESMTAWHATDPPSVHLAIHARTEGVSVADVERELNDSRSLVKQLAMRRTLFAFPPSLYAAALASASARVAAAHARSWGKTLENAGITRDADAWLEAAGAEILALLADGTPRTSTEIAAAIPLLAQRIELSAGTKWAATVAVAPNTLTLFGARGVLVRGPNGAHWRLSKPTWTTPDHWLREPPATTTAGEGWATLVAAYLRTFGPATEDDITWWLGATKTSTRAALRDTHADEVRLEDGRAAYLHPDDDETDTDEPGTWAALTPTLDPTVMGWKHRGHYLRDEDRPYLVDSVGNAAMTAWVDGWIVGSWVQDDSGRVTVLPRQPLPPSGQALLHAEAERLTAFFDGTIIPTPYGKALAAGHRLA